MISEELVDRGVSSKKIRIIPNGINDTFKDGLETKNICSGNSFDPSLLYVGRLIEEKNIHLIIEMVEKLKNEFPNIGLVVVGDGVYKKELVELAKTMKITDHVMFKGFMKAIDDIISDCSIFILPSRTEGMPISILEAMSHARPIVASKVGSIPSMARDGLEAILVTPGDRDQLYHSIYMLLKDDALRNELGRNARDRFLDMYTSEIMANNYIKFYESVVGKI